MWSLEKVVHAEPGFIPFDAPDIRRAKVRNLGYSVRSDFELNFGRYLPAFGRADDKDAGK